MPKPLDRFVERLLARSELSAASQQLLLSIKAPLSSKRARWDLVRAGEKVDFACLVAEGIIGRSEQFADGRRRTAAIYLAGDMCDLHSVAVPVAGWNITALTDARIYEVPHKALHEAFAGHEDIALAFWRDTIADASILSKWVAVLGGMSSRERVAHMLCEYGIRAQMAGIGTRTEFIFPLTQTQLAELVGTTAVHMSRIMRQLAKEAAIEQNRGHVVIRDLRMLERIAEYDPTYLLFKGGSPLSGERA